MSRLKQGFSRRRSPYPIPQQADHQDYVVGGRRERYVESNQGSGVKRLVWRVLVESALIFALLVGVVAVTYWAGIRIFDDWGESSTEPSQGQSDVAGLPAQPGAAPAGGYLIQLSDALSIEQADQTLSRLRASYGNLLGSLNLSVRARQSQGGQPVYYVIAGPLFSPITAEDLCGQIEASGRGDPCIVLPQSRPKPAAAAPAPSPTVSQAPAPNPVPSPAPSPVPNPVPSQAGYAGNPEVVALVQRRLLERGLQPGNLSGQIDAQTTEAIRSYQVTYGLAPSGEITTELLDSLIGQRSGQANAAPAQAAPANPVQANPTPAVTLPLDAAQTPAYQLPPAAVAERTQPAAGAPAAGALRQAVNPLTSRANEFLKMGDFSSARLLFEQAFAQGDARAAAGIALTFDPVYYQEAGVIGMSPNPDQAVAWYRRAIDAGDRSSINRLEQLIKWLQRRSASNPEARRILEALQ